MSKSAKGRCALTYRSKKVAMTRHYPLWAIGILGLVNVVLGVVASSVFLAAGGAAGICFAAVRLKMTWPQPPSPVSPQPKADIKWTPPVPAVERYPADPDDPTRGRAGTEDDPTRGRPGFYDDAMRGIDPRTGKPIRYRRPSRDETGKVPPR